MEKPVHFYYSDIVLELVLETMTPNRIQMFDKKFKTIALTSGNYIQSEVEEVGQLV